MGKLFEILSWIWSKFGKYVEVFLSHYGLPVAAVSLMGALVCVYFWAAQVESIVAFSSQSLEQEREPVAQKFSALESQLLSAFSTPTDGAEYLRSNGEKAFEAIDDKLRDLTPLDAATLAGQLQLASPPEEDSRSLRSQFLTLAGSGEAGKGADGPHNANSLFVPAVLLPTDPAKPDADSTALTPADLVTVLNRDPQLRMDLTASLQIYPSLERLIGKQFDKWGYPLQAYFITRTGIFAGALGTRQGRTQRSPTRIYFAERPYFWKTVDLLRGEFYLTYPYIDLLGKGVIFSACRAVTARPVSNAIICLDFPVQKAVESLKNRLKPFQIAAPVSLSCHVADNGDVEGCTLESNTQDYRRVVDLVNLNLETLSKKGSLDQITGGVFRLESEELYPVPIWKRILMAALNGMGLGTPDAVKGLMFFTVPVGKERDAQKFLVYAIDVNAPQWALLGYGAGFAFCLLLLSLSLYYTHQARKLAMTFVDDLQKVMQISPVPFVHLDEDTRMVGSNQAFRLLTGFSEEQLRERTLSSILSKRSALRYARVAPLRQEYRMTNPYEVEIVCANGHREKVVAQGAPLHMPPGRFRRFFVHKVGAKGTGALPHTFGILVHSGQAQGRFIDLSIGDDLFAAALQVDLQEYAEEEDKTEASPA